MDDEIVKITKEAWTLEKSMTDKTARLLALVPYLKAAVEDITEMENTDYTPQLVTTSTGLIQVREEGRFDTSTDDTLKELVRQLDEIREEKEKYKELETLLGKLRQSFHNEMNESENSVA